MAILRNIGEGTFLFADDFRAPVVTSVWDGWRARKPRESSNCKKKKNRSNQSRLHIQEL
jgi:hypothetical protein